MSPSLWWRFLLCVGVCHGLLLWLARALDERRLRHVVLASFWLRLGLGIMLYAISYYHWPLLRSLQGGDGFWAFALDARLYHEWGARIAEAWKQGIELPDPGMSYDYLTIIAVIYRLVGAHPLYAIALHAWLGALTGWLAYRIGERLFDRRIALRAAVLVGFWPSSLLWSSQILRDVVSWCLILTILWLVTLMVGPDARPFRVRWWRSALQAVALAGAVILLTRLRVYLGSIFALTALVTLVPVACAYLMSRQVGEAVWRTILLISRQVSWLVGRCAGLIRSHVARAVGLGSLTALMIGAVVMGRVFNTTLLLSPAHPEEGHLRLGLQHQSAGDLALAEAEFRRAIDSQLDYQPAYLLWAGMLSAAHRPLEALEICASWSGADPDGAMSRCVNQLKAWSEEQKMLESDSPRTPPEREPVLASPPAPKPRIRDATAPTVPTGLQARAFSSTQVTLSWSASTDNVAVAGYHILRDGILVGTSVGLSHQDTRLAPNTPYTYTVVAVDAAGNLSAQTPAVTATTPRTAPARPPPPSGLLAHWPLDEGSGTIVAEASDQYPHGRLHDGPRWIRESLGAFLSFDGVDDYVDAGPIPPVIANFTVAGWVYRRGEFLPREPLAMWCSQGLDGQDGWAVDVHESDGRVLHGFLKGGVALITSGVPSASDTWEHVAWVVDAQARPTLYLNGILAAKGVHALPIRLPASGVTTYLGADQSPPATPGRFFPGALDDVRLYRRVLTAAEIADIAEAAPTTKLPRRAGRRHARRKTTPPKVEAGPAQTVREPQQAALQGEAQSPGPQPVRIADPTALDTSVEEVIENRPPKVEAGPAQTVPRPQTVVLRGEVRDDGRPTNTLTYQWTQTLGPPARFATPNALETRVQLPERTRYHFSLTASDGALTALDEVSVTVEARSIGTIVSGLANQVPTLLQEMSPQWLGSLRGSIVVSGGNTLVDVRADISQPLNLLAYLPRALLIGFLAPFPWQWFDASGSMGGMRVFAGAETALVYLLLIGLALRAWRAIRLFGLLGCVRLAIRRTQLGRFFLLVYGLVAAASASLVMANFGTLFRLRLLFWLPLIILVAAGNPLGSFAWYRRLVRRMDRWRGGPPAIAVEPAPVGEETPGTAPQETLAGARGGASR